MRVEESVRKAPGNFNEAYTTRKKIFCNKNFQVCFKYEMSPGLCIWRIARCNAQAESFGRIFPQASDACAIVAA
jgi:hypothetical protein